MDLFLSPHNDDETLFGAFTILRHRPHVVVCLKSQVQEDRYGITAATREAETTLALEILQAPSWEQLKTKDSGSFAGDLLDDFRMLESRYAPRRVFAPAYEEGGHEQHNGVARLSYSVFGSRVCPYFTYVRGLGRRGNTTRAEVSFEPEWLALKLRAMACYESQCALDNTRFWFMDDTLREFVPHG